MEIEVEVRELEEAEEAEAKESQELKDAPGSRTGRISNVTLFLRFFTCRLVASWYSEIRSS